jgi:tRNA A-37 threonylcarbamoyl transferase component Bud32
VRLSIADPADHPDFLDLPLERPLAAWTSPRLVDIPQGMHRHVVRFCDYGGTLYALKELPRHLALREYRLLRHLAAARLPAVTAVGVVDDRALAGGEAILITQHLDYSLPYRLLLTNERMPHLRERVLDALAGMLVRLHLAGFFWGDCSLANSLFRRDAGALTAYVVDVETGELHAELTDGQRDFDVSIAFENIAGGLADLEASGDLPADIDPIETAEQIGARYAELWREVTSEEVFAAGETYRINARLRRLNDLGFDLEEMEISRSAGGEQVRLKPRVVEIGYHGPRLQELTGLRTQENQARRLLNDIAVYRSRLEQESERPVPETVAAARWLDRVFEPAVDAIPDELRGKLEAAEVYHQLLEHRWFLSQQRGLDVGMGEAMNSYVANVLRHAPEERSVLTNAEASGAAGDVG